MPKIKDKLGRRRYFSMKELEAVWDSARKRHPVQRDDLRPAP